jgi:hypothetical protein
MHLVRALQFLFLLSLAVVLFGGEVGESACFVDDVSNDYIEAPTSPNSFAEMAPADLMPQRTNKVAEEFVWSFAVTPSNEAVLSSGSDLLRLLSIQRK